MGDLRKLINLFLMVSGFCRAGVHREVRHVQCSVSKSLDLQRRKSIPVRNRKYCGIKKTKVSE